MLIVIFFYDITDVILNTRIAKCTDDTDIFVADKDLNVIKTKLTNEMDFTVEWRNENSLIINTNKAKTESLRLLARYDVSQGSV